MYTHFDLRNLKPGNSVLVVNEAKLKKHPGTKNQSKWSGPFPVKRVQDSTVEVETPRKSKRVRIEKVKPYITRPKVEMSQVRLLWLPLRNNELNFNSNLQTLLNLHLGI